MGIEMVSDYSNMFSLFDREAPEDVFDVAVNKIENALKSKNFLTQINFKEGDNVSARGNLLMMALFLEQYDAVRSILQDSTFDKMLIANHSTMEIELGGIELFSKSINVLNINEMIVFNEHIPDDIRKTLMNIMVTLNYTNVYFNYRINWIENRIVSYSGISGLKERNTEELFLVYVDTLLNLLDKKELDWKEYYSWIFENDMMMPLHKSLREKEFYIKMCELFKEDENKLRHLLGNMTVEALFEVSVLRELILKYDDCLEILYKYYSFDNKLKVTFITKLLRIFVIDDYSMLCWPKRGITFLKGELSNIALCVNDSDVADLLSTKRYQGIFSMANTFYYSKKYMRLAREVLKTESPTIIRDAVMNGIIRDDMIQESIKYCITSGKLAGIPVLLASERRK